MKINFILILLICFFNSCNTYTSKKDLLDSIHKQNFLFIRPLIIALDANQNTHIKKKNKPESTNKDILECTIQISLDSVSENNIQISKDQISLTLPRAKLNTNSVSLSDKAKEILNINSIYVDELKSQLQDEATTSLSNILKTKGFKIIKIRFTSSKQIS